MRKLTQGRIARIIDDMEKGRAVHAIATSAGVTPQWVRTLWRRSGEGAVVPVLRSPGRPRREVTDEERALVLEAERRFDLHPRALERAIERAYGVHVPHNRIWTILKEAGLVTDSPKKQRRRAWVRFERRFANSLWQMDYTQIGPRDWILVLLDDASRLVVGHARTDRPTAELAWDTFRAAGERYGYPRQVLTDWGTQFTKEQYEAVGLFDERLRGLRRAGVPVQHIKGRRNHPQTGGKAERVIGTIKSRLDATWPDGTRKYRDLDDVVRWYNEVKPHESLDFEKAETPAEAFVRKLRPMERKAFLRRRGGGTG